MYSIIKLIAIIVLIYHTSGNSQMYDFNWVFGYGGGLGDSRFGTTKVEFNSGNPIQKFILEGRLRLMDANASISTLEGRLLYYTNGYELEDSNYIRIKNALDVGTRFWEALIAQQGVLFLPINNGKEFLLFYIYLERIDGEFLITKINYLRLDLKLNILEKNSLIAGNFNDGFLNACKHANGRDWWVLLNKKNSNIFYNILIEQSGKFNIDSFQVGPVILDGVGQSKFTNNGNYLTTIEGVTFGADGTQIYLYNFDRCIGRLIPISNKSFNAVGIAGISFSSNSKNLYYSEDKVLYQFDLNSSVNLDNPALIDSIIDQTLPWGSQYDQHQLGPDGRIYITNLYSNFYQHVINKPNELGKACDARSNGFILKTLNRRGISNNPNYRLGPIDGSICDTLGIDNIPWAWWRHEQDTMDYLRFEFTDLSAYEVTEWEWSFGDGSSSTTQHPIHKYKDKGVYEVCLIAKNKNGADTLCRTLNVGITSVDNSSKLIKIEAFPNPCDEYFMINVLDYIPERMMMSLIDLNGKEVLSKRLYEGSNGVDVAGLTQGVYVINLKENDRIVYSDKMVIIRE